MFKVESGYVCEGDHKTIAKAIKDRVSLISRKRTQRQQVHLQDKPYVDILYPDAFLGPVVLGFFA